MKIINRIKDSVENTLGNELLGTEEFEKPEDKKVEKKPKETNQKKKKSDNKLFSFDFSKKQPKKETPPKKSLKETIEDKKEKDTGLKAAYTTQDFYENLENVDEDAIIHTEGSEFEFLGLEFIDIPAEIVTSSDIDNVEFELIAPVGLDPNQVAPFLDKVELDIEQIYSLFEKNKENFNKLMKEYNSLENKYIAQRQELELTTIFNTSKSEEDKLKDQIFELKLEIQELKTVNDNLKRELKKVKYTRPQETVSKQNTIIPKIPVEKPSKTKNEKNKAQKEEHKTSDDVFNDLMEDLM